jgi:hypothetical protein
MKATSWITYRTRFLVQAKQLSTSITFTDSLGRQHSGRKGDYLVESSDGVLRVAPRQIFQDIYVPLLSNSKKTSPGSASPPDRKPWRLTYSQARMEEQILPPRPPRKSPQPDRARRNNPGQRSL